MMPFVCFIWAAAFGVLNVFLPSGFRALKESDRIRANETVLVPPSRKIISNIMDRSSLTMTSDCEADSVLALLA